jgi:hypothetical protein
MKKSLVFGVALLLALSFSVFAWDEGDRPAIEAAIDAYEAVVEAAEELAEMHLVDPEDFEGIDWASEEAEGMLAEIFDEDGLTFVKDWQIEDARRSAELNVRFNQAIGAMVAKLLSY